MASITLAARRALLSHATPPGRLPVRLPAALAYFLCSLLSEPGRLSWLYWWSWGFWRRASQSASHTRVSGRPPALGSPSWLFYACKLAVPQRCGGIVELGQGGPRCPENRRPCSTGSEAYGVVRFGRLKELKRAGPYKRTMAMPS